MIEEEREGHSVWGVGEAKRRPLGAAYQTSGYEESDGLAKRRFEVMKPVPLFGVGPSRLEVEHVPAGKYCVNAPETWQVFATNGSEHAVLLYQSDDQLRAEAVCRLIGELSRALRACS